ncbi:hypothetical protein F5148DRAFT_1197375 [Russula earlei]|uniref:Uncharacterized protein n=1 Tax=Russula earlei TaxID=71964 RepID=A0ACC0UB37_9AGAM|nr:hypothetical protein F5148DRAFT_1197375 [Russula earlei]
MRTFTVFAFLCLAVGVTPSFAVPWMSPRGENAPSSGSEGPSVRISGRLSESKPSRAGREQAPIELPTLFTPLGNVAPALHGQPSPTRPTTGPSGDSTSNTERTPTRKHPNVNAMSPDTPTPTRSHPGGSKSGKKGR